MALMTTTTDTYRKVEWRALLESALTAEGQFSDTYTRFYNYSFGNCCLLLMQGARGPVATYKRWGEMGRQVQKGSRAMEILRPVVIKRPDPNDPDNAIVFTRFKFVKCLFDVQATEGEPLPEVETPEWSKSRALEALGITETPYTSLDGNMQGYSTAENTVSINPVAIHPFKTLIHEVAHLVLGHPKNMTEYAQHRGVAEAQAESTAYLVLHALGLQDSMDDSESRAYIQTWLAKDEFTDAAARQVLTTVDAILRAGREATK